MAPQSKAHNCHFFPMSFAESLGPANFARISLHLESFVAFWATKSENFAIIPHKCYSMTGIDWRRAKVALFCGNEHKRTNARADLSSFLMFSCETGTKTGTTPARVVRYLFGSYHLVFWGDLPCFPKMSFMSLFMKADDQVHSIFFFSSVNLIFSLENESGMWMLFPGSRSPWKILLRQTLPIARHRRWLICLTTVCYFGSPFWLIFNRSLCDFWWTRYGNQYIQILRRRSCEIVL